MNGPASWDCKFEKEIKKEETGVAFKNNQMILKLNKKIPGETWKNFGEEVLLVNLLHVSID